MCSGRNCIELGKYTSLEAGILLRIYHKAINCLNQVHQMIQYNVYLASSSLEHPVLSSRKRCADSQCLGRSAVSEDPTWVEYGRLTTEVWYQEPMKLIGQKPHTQVAPGVGKNLRISWPVK